MAINSDLNFHELVICVNIWVRKDGKFLVLRRSPHKKVLPNVIHPIGGKLDTGEDPFMGAQRELMEEAGITVDNMKLEAVIFDLVDKVEKYGYRNWMIFHFSADYAAGEIQKTEEGTLELLTKEQILAEEKFPSVQKSAEYILDESKGTVFCRFEFDKDGNMIGETINFCR